MARKRNPKNPWIGYEEQARARLRDAIENPYDYSGSRAAFECIRRTHGRDQICKARLARLIAEVTGTCSSKTTLDNWLKDPGQVAPDMAELLSRLLGFDSVEEVRTGLPENEQRDRADEYEEMNGYLEEARGYLAMIGEEGAEARESALETLRSLAMAKRDGPKKGEAYRMLAKGEGLAALKRLDNERKVIERTARRTSIPREWLKRLNRVEEMLETEDEKKLGFLRNMYGR